MATGTYIADGLTNLDPETGQVPCLVWTFGAHAVDIEIDVETGNIDVLKVVSAFDVGQVINENSYMVKFAWSSTRFGFAILEGYKFNEDVRLMNPSFTDNKIPTMKDMPKEIVAIYIENPQMNGPYGARGVAEHPMISVPSALVMPSMMLGHQFPRSASFTGSNRTGYPEWEEIHSLHRCRLPAWSSLRYWIEPLTRHDIPHKCLALA